MKRRIMVRGLACIAVALAFALACAPAYAQEGDQQLIAGGARMQTQDYVQTYTLDGQLIADTPGVYKVKAVPGASKDGDNPSTIGIPSVAKQNLENGPTQESPAIIMGAAVNYEKKTGPTSYEPLSPDAKLVAPYKYFRWSVVDEQLKDPDGNITVHKKLSGFDGSYYIVRVDVSDLINVENPEGKYLHVKQTDNKALMVAVGFVGTTYSNGGSKTGSYSLANAAAALKDDGADDADKDTPYLDVIVMSSGKLVAGADAGGANAPSADIKLSFYVDGTEDYKPELTALDPNNMPTFPYQAPDGVTYQDELSYNNALLTKYYDDEKAKDGENASSYLVKGSDLEIDVTVDEQDEGASAGTPPDFWSLTKAMDYQAYDGHIIKLICEVPVLEALQVDSDVAGQARNVILDVNSFDIQIANNTEHDKAGLTIANGATLRIMDGTNTSGAELAIGNNASMVIKKGGVLVIDESCTNEVEYDAATVPAGETLPDLAIGEITVEDGGQLINQGVVNIEGMESKPVQPGQQDTQVMTDMKRADMFVNAGGVFDNYGCLSLKGDMYVLGTLNNYGKYNDVIEAHDPDKGTTSYHKGIQVTWKDVVTAPGVEPGVLNIGIGAKPAEGEERVIEKNAVLNNYGDIVLVPGTFVLYGTFNNAKNPNEGEDYAGHLYLCTVDEAIIPVIDPNDPLHVEDRVAINPPKASVFDSENGTVNTDGGVVDSARVLLIHNGVLGELIPSEQEIANEKAAIEAAKTAVSQAQQAMEDLLGQENPDKAQIEAAYKKIVEAQNALAAAQEKLSLAENAQASAQLASLQAQVNTLTSALADVSVVDISNFAASLSATSCEYTGKAITPVVTVSGLTADDYTVAYADNTAIGTAKVTIEGKADKNFKGKIEKTFQITKKANAVNAKNAKKAFKAKKLKKKAASFQINAVVKATGAKGKVTYSAKPANAKSKKVLKVKGNKVKVKKKAKKGTYKLNVTVKDAGNAIYNAASKTVTVTVKVG